MLMCGFVMLAPRAFLVQESEGFGVENAAFMYALVLITLKIQVESEHIRQYRLVFTILIKFSFRL